MSRLDTIWEDSGAWQAFAEAMRDSLISNSNQESRPDDGRGPMWLGLPALCCQAIGGDPRLTDGITAAWELLYTAAHIMDAIEDGDQMLCSPRTIAPGVAINIATGLYASMGLLLTKFLPESISIEACNEIQIMFHDTILQMCSGQHYELTSEEPNLEAYWDIAKAKSGAFFALACQSGARLGTDDPSIIAHFREFGLNLGILIQIGDDAKDIWGTDCGDNVCLPKSPCNLAVVYALSVSQPEGANSIRSALRAGIENNRSLADLRLLLEDAGAPLYIATKMEQHCIKAQKALQKTNCEPLNEVGFFHILEQISILGTI